MNKKLKDKEGRIKEAMAILRNLIDDIPAPVLRRADDSGCLPELEIVCQEVKQWLSDDDWAEDLAYEL